MWELLQTFYAAIQLARNPIEHGEAIEVMEPRHGGDEREAQAREHPGAEWLDRMRERAVGLCLHRDEPWPLVSDETSKHCHKKFAQIV